MQGRRAGRERAVVPVSDSDSPPTIPSRSDASRSHRNFSSSVRDVPFQPSSSIGARVAHDPAAKQQLRERRREETMLQREEETETQLRRDLLRTQRRADLQHEEAEAGEQAAAHQRTTRALRTERRRNIVALERDERQRQADADRHYRVQLETAAEHARAAEQERQSRLLSSLERREQQERAERERIRRALLEVRKSRRHAMETKEHDDEETTKRQMAADLRAVQEADEQRAANQRATAAVRQLVRCRRRLEAQWTRRDASSSSSSASSSDRSLRVATAVRVQRHQKELLPSGRQHAREAAQREDLLRQTTRHQARQAAKASTPPHSPPTSMRARVVAPASPASTSDSARDEAAATARWLARSKPVGSGLAAPATVTAAPATVTATASRAPLPKRVVIARSGSESSSSDVGFVHARKLGPSLGVASSSQGPSAHSLYNTTTNNNHIYNRSTSGRVDASLRSHRDESVRGPVLSLSLLA